jgi:DnaJ-domain-containing protein 1
VLLGGREPAGLVVAPRERKENRMTTDDTRAIVTISLLAAFADGSKHERERAEIRRTAEGLAYEMAVGACDADGAQSPAVNEAELDSATLNAAILNEAQGLQSRYLPQMQEWARTLDATQVMNLVRQG